MAGSSDAAGFATERDRLRMMTPWRSTACLGAALLAAAVVTACQWPWSGGAENGAIELSGTIDAREVDLAFQAGGRIALLRSDEGETVTADQIVAELDGRDYELAHARARAQAEAAGQALAELKAGSRPQEIRAAEAAVTEAEAQRRIADSEVTRLEKLAPKDFTSREQLDNARNRAAAAGAQAEQARARLALLREGPRREEIARAQAEYDAAEAALASAARQLSYVKLLSPVGGVVSARLAEAGQVIAAGQAVLRIAQLDRPWVRAYLNERDLARVALGQAAEVRVDGLPDTVFKGRLSFISPVAEFTPKTVETRALRVDLVYRVKVDVEDPQGRLKIGMPADVSLAPGHG